MRRFCTFLIVALLLTCLLGTASADIDLTGMTIEELRELREKVDYAIFEKDGAIILEPGAYVAGKDIAPGSYVLSFYPNKRSLTYGSIKVFVSTEAMIAYESDYSDYRLQVNMLERNAENGHEVAIADKPEKFEIGKYLTTNIDEGFDAGVSYRISLEEGQVLMVDCNTSDMHVTIQKAKGLFMD